MAKGKSKIVNRMNFIFFFFLLFSAFLISKIFYIQNLESEFEGTSISLETIKNIEVESTRGNIYSSNGDLIASTVSKFEIRWDSQVPSEKIFESNKVELAQKLSELLTDSTDYYIDIMNNARKNKNRYLFIAKDLDINQLNLIKTFPMFNLGIYKGGLIIKENHLRKSHLGKIAERTIGSFHKGIKEVGLEKAYSQYLGGKNGIRLMQKIAKGEWKPLRTGYEIEPKQGYDLHTTIDLKIQDFTHNELLSQLEKFEADHGTAIIMETKTGNVLGISNLGINSEGNYYERLNYAIGEKYEPGSTFKLMALITALEDGLVEHTDSIDTKNGVLKIGSHEVIDSNKKGYGKITVAKAFEVSSNTGMVKMVYDNYKSKPERFVNRLYNMKLNEKINTPIAGEPTPIMPHPSDEEWNSISLPWMAFGYGVYLTPIQILTFYNAVANNGEMVKPKFVNKISSIGNKPIYEIEREVIMPSICSQKTLDVVKEMLQNIVEKPWGTANGIDNDYVKIAGKTGTSQTKYWSNGDEPIDKQYIASFVGYFPSDNPKYTGIVVIHEPKKSKGYYGGTVAAPVFKRIAQKIQGLSPTVVEIDKKDIDNLF